MKVASWFYSEKENGTAYYFEPETEEEKKIIDDLKNKLAGTHPNGKVKLSKESFFFATDTNSMSINLSYRRPK